MTLWKSEPTAPQSVKAKTTTPVKIGGKTAFKPAANESKWHWQINLDIPVSGAPTMVRTELVRSNGDATEQRTWNLTGMAGEHFHIGAEGWDLDWTGTVSLHIWHNGTKPLRLLGRQIKVKP